MRFTPIIASFVLATCAHGQHIVEILPPDGFEACSPRDLSTSGDVVVGNASGTGSRFAAFRWTPDTGSEVLPGLPGLPAKWASAVSAVMSRVTASPASRPLRPTRPSSAAARWRRRRRGAAT